MEKVIWWIRKDLRLGDNPVLRLASDQARQVIPVFILDDQLLFGRRSSEKRRLFLFEGLRDLSDGISRRGGRLIIRQGKPIQEIGRLLEETNATAIFAEPDYSPYAQKRDAKVSAEFPITWVGSPAIQPPTRVLKPDGNPYTVFTHYSRAWRALELQSDPNHEVSFCFEQQSISLESLSVHDLPCTPNRLFPAGELEARHRLHRFLSAAEEEMHLEPPLARYKLNRNRLDLDDTSRLSPYLKFGMISAREVASSALSSIGTSQDHLESNSLENWFNELIWRDFYLQILYHFPEVTRGNFRTKHIRWINDPGQFKIWCSGETGYPVVDAAMRQLEQTGWINNRARMIVASFLCKDLLVDWRWGEEWFMRQLIDGDPAANNGGWQWTAGTGTDAAPYFRIINPVIQSQKYDPNGMFIRAWLPELEAVPIQYLHTPWTMPASVQSMSGCKIGKDYPAPVVDHAWARQRALQAYRQPAEQIY